MQISRSLLMNKLRKTAHQVKIAIILKILAAIGLLAIMESMQSWKIYYSTHLGHST